MCAFVLMCVVDLQGDDNPNNGGPYLSAPLIHTHMLHTHTQTHRHHATVRTICDFNEPNLQDHQVSEPGN